MNSRAILSAEKPEHIQDTIWHELLTANSQPVNAAEKPKTYWDVKEEADESLKNRIKIMEQHHLFGEALEVVFGSKNAKTAANKIKWDQHSHDDGGNRTHHCMSMVITKNYVTDTV